MTIMSIKEINLGFVEQAKDYNTTSRCVVGGSGAGNHAALDRSVSRIDGVLDNEVLAAARKAGAPVVIVSHFANFVFGNGLFAGRQCVVIYDELGERRAEVCKIDSVCVGNQQHTG